MRLDFIFSYWILVWYIGYMFKWIRYNPKVALLLGLIENGILVLLMIFYRTPILPYFLAVNMVIKVIPFLSIQKKMQWGDLYDTFGLFVVYLVWLKLNGQSYTTMVKEMHRFAKGDASVFPVSNWLRNTINVF